MNRIWGSTVGEGSASRVALISDAFARPSQAQPMPYILPHKKQGPRPALAAGQLFTLSLQRLIGCESIDWTTAQNAMKIWLLIGGLGLRANRASGSVWPVGTWVPQTAGQLVETLRSFGFHWPVQLVETPNGTPSEELRRLASDTVRGQPRLFGDIKPRTPSPTRFKIVELAGRVRLLVTAPPSVDLLAVRTALASPKKAGQYPWRPL